MFCSSIAIVNLVFQTSSKIPLMLLRPAFPLLLGNPLWYPIEVEDPVLPTPPERGIGVSDPKKSSVSGLASAAFGCEIRLRETKLPVALPVALPGVAPLVREESTPERRSSESRSLIAAGRYAPRRYRREDAPPERSGNTADKWWR